MEKVEKLWGWEKWFANTDDYCGKEIFVRKGIWSSKGNYHYHPIKDESFYVIKGVLRLDIIPENDGPVPDTIIIQKGGSCRVKPGVRHRFTAMNLMGCHFIEASTTHREEDSIRCYYVGTEKEGQWIDL